MRLLIPVLSLVLAGAVPGPSDPAPPGPQSPAPADLSHPRLAGDPDEARCREALSIASGREGEAQLRREPASPDRPLPIRAVDYQVDKCHMLVMTDGEVRLPPELPEQEQGLMPAH